MKKIIPILLLVLFSGIVNGQENQQKRLKKHLYTLAADSLRGREAGTDDGRRAANYILSQWQQMGLKPMFGDSYRMPFSLSSKQPNSNGDYCNLVAVIEGNDPVMKNEYIVLGAHYDHVGVKGDKIYNGADDNASGSACLLEIARQLLARQHELRRSVIICAFDAEEKGLYGSKDFVKQLYVKGMSDNVKLMLSIDMVGWYSANGELVLEGSGTLRNPKDILLPDKLGIGLKVRLKSFENSLFTATDTEPFAEEGIPTLAVTTGLKSPYHKPEDDADLIDYEGLDSITDYLTALTVAVSKHENKLASGRFASKHQRKPFEAGVAVGFNSSHLNFSDATFEGNSLIGFQGGLILQYNLPSEKVGFLSVRAKVLYDYSHSPLPLDIDAYGKGYKVELHSLLVPVTLQLNFFEMGSGVYIGAGLFYRQIFDGSFYGPQVALAPAYSLNKSHVGFAWNFGCRLGGHWQLDNSWCFSWTELFNGAALPTARQSIYSFTVGYYF